MKEITRSRKSKNRQFNDKKKEKSLKIPNQWLEAVNRRADNTTAKGKRIKYM